MTVTRLSACAVKVQLTAEELHRLLPEDVTSADSQQVLRLLSILLVHAEACSGIRFSALPVTVELLAGSDNSLTVYFTAKLPKPKRKAKTIRLAARFSEYDVLSACCRQLIRSEARFSNSELYRCGSHWILTLKLNREYAQQVHHILLEYGKPYRSSTINKARLAEYGNCIHSEDAIRSILREGQRRS